MGKTSSWVDATIWQRSGRPPSSWRDDLRKAHEMDATSRGLGEIAHLRGGQVQHWTTTS